MKKIITVLALSFAAFSALGQPLMKDYECGLFNHLSFGAGFGTDGLSFELAAPIGPFVQVRAGYGFASFDAGLKVKTLQVPEHPGDNYEESAKVNVPLYACPGINTGRLLFNIYPGRGTAFFFSVGGFYGSRNYINVKGTGLPDDYNTTGYETDGYIIRAVDNVGRAQIRQNAFKPYVGIGLGRPVGGKRVNATVDLGVQYMGDAKLYVWGNATGLVGSDAWVEIDRGALGEFAHYYDDVKAFVRFWPTISFRMWFTAL